MLAARQLSRRLLRSNAACGALAKACASSSSSSATRALSSVPLVPSRPPSPSPPPPPRDPSRSFSSSEGGASPTPTVLRESYEYILAERRFPEEGGDGAAVAGGGVGVITLHRPKALNALCDALFEDLIHAARAFEDDDGVGCIVITGSGKAFAAGEFGSW